MEKFNETSLHVLAVAGGGCDPDKSSVVYRMIKSHVEDNGYDYHPITGCVDEGDDYVVQTPADQLENIHNVVEDVRSKEEDAKFLLVAQCLGSSATMKYLMETNPDQSVKAVIFSPATNPGEVLSTKKSQSRRREQGTRLRVNHLKGGTRDYALDVEKAFTARIPEDYVEQHEAFGDLVSEMKSQIEMGRLALIATEHDWNTASIEDIRRMKTYISSGDATKRIDVMAEAGHSLHVPNSISDDSEYRLSRQYENAAQVLEVGASLHRTQPRASSSFRHKSV